MTPPASTTAPRAEGSKPLRQSKAYQRATEFLNAIDDIDAETGREIVERIGRL